jgi:hypothetical protein
VFAVGDGLGPYRRLIDAADAWLADDGVVLLQLYRRVFAASRPELPILRAALNESSSSEDEGSAAARWALAQLAA